MKPHLRGLGPDGALLVFTAKTRTDRKLGRKGTDDAYQPVTVVLELPADFINAYLGRSEAVVRACSPASEQGVDVDSARPASTPDQSKEEA